MKIAADDGPKINIGLTITAAFLFLIPFIFWVLLNTIKPDRIMGWTFSKFRIIGVSLLIFGGLALVLLGVAMA